MSHLSSTSQAKPYQMSLLQFSLHVQTHSLLSNYRPSSILQFTSKECFVLQRTLIPIWDMIWCSCRRTLLRKPTTRTAKMYEQAFFMFVVSGMTNIHKHYFILVSKPFPSIDHLQRFQLNIGFTQQENNNFL